MGMETSKKMERQKPAKRTARGGEWDELGYITFGKAITLVREMKADHGGLSSAWMNDNRRVELTLHYTRNGLWSN